MASSDRLPSRPPLPDTPPAKPTARWPLILFILFALGMYLVVHAAQESMGAQHVPYSVFEKALEAGQIHSVEIGDDWARGYPENVLNPTQPASPAKATAGTVYQTNLVPGTAPALTQELRQRGIPFSAVPPSRWGPMLFWSLAPFLLLIVFWGWALRRAGSQLGGGPRGILSFGKMQARVVVESETGVGFKDVAGVDEAVEELKEIVDFLQTPDKFRRLGARIPKGVLLVGPPGTGKTLLARAVAGEAHVPFFSLTGSQFVEMFVGVGAARVRDLFAQAQQKAPCIIFIDELDAIGRSRGVGLMTHEEREQTLDQLLAEMDGFDPRVGLIVLAATNRPEVLDPALLRPGRFDRQVLVDRPDKIGREKILRLHAREVKVGEGVDFGRIAAETPGFVGADLANIVNEGALLAARRGKQNVSMHEFEEAIERVIAGLEKKGRRLNVRERRIVAHHESGHAVVGWMLPSGERVSKVSIVPRGIAALGYTRQGPLEDRYLLSEPELHAKIATLLAGRVAEELIFGQISTGSSNDLVQATEIARAMVREYGMSTELGPVAWGDGHRPLFLTPAGPQSFDVGTLSERTHQLVDSETQRLIEEGLKTARMVLSEHRDKLETLAGRLLKQEVIEEDELESILGPKEGVHELGEPSQVYAPPPVEPQPPAG